MKFSVDKREKFVLLELNEEKLNSLTGPKLKSELVVLNAEGYNNVILNLQEVKFVDSSGLSSILVGSRLCKESGGTFVLCCLSDAVQRLVKISQLDGILNIFPTEAEAKDFVMMEELERELKK